MGQDFDLSPEGVAKWFASLKENTTERVSDPFKPASFAEYIGQDKAKKLLTIAVDAALKEHRALPNLLIAGSYGQGKTSLAELGADRYEKGIPLVDAASVNRSPEDFASGTKIIDEIHNLAPEICDSFNILIDANKVHIIGCTTDPGALPVAFRSRFRQIILEDYSEKDIILILRNVLQRKSITIEKRALEAIATRSRLNPRVALNYLAFILDVVSLKNFKKITIQLVEEGFHELGVDAYGFLTRDYTYLSALPTDGRPVGLQYLSARTSIDIKTIEQEVEPYLMKMGLVDRTMKGRIRVMGGE